MNYAKEARAATKEIQSAGQPVVVTHVTTGEYDPATGVVTTTTTVQNGHALSLSYSLSEIDGTLIQRDDKKIMLAVGGITAVETGDTCLMGGVTYSVKSVQPFAPGGVVIFYYVQLRA